MHPGSVLRDKALRTLQRETNEPWLEAAVSAIEHIAALRGAGGGLTSDAVWAVLERQGINEIPSDNRAMGAAFTRARSRGICEPTERTKLSERPEQHRRPLRVWRLCAPPA